jgi:tellurite resistance protein TehA-like permease
MGGCDDIKALHEKGELEREILVGLIHRQRSVDTAKLESAKLVPMERSMAVNPPFWFPNTVNNRVVRLTGVQVFILSVLSASFPHELWARYLAVGLLVDFCIRLVAGSAVSPLGMIATVLCSHLKPNFKPGPPKQFASFCGVFFTSMGTLFYFLEFENHEYVATAWMAMLAVAAGLEGFFDFCLGCVFFGYGIQYGLIPSHVYRIHTATRQETIDSWEYMYTDSNAPEPTNVDTDPSSPVSLKYKKKTDEWTKDDFDPIRHMQVSYFGMPLSITGLSVAFKIAGNWTGPLAGLKRSIIVPDAWFHVTAAIGAFFSTLFFLMYATRLVMYPHKCCTEWDCPLRSNSFGAITITTMLFSFIVYDEINTDPNGDEPPQILARVLFWVGAIGHTLMTIAKMGEWIGRRLELEHVHPQYMMFPVGLAVAALVAPVVKPFADDNGNSVGNVEIARFYYSFAWLMWITLFIITFFKVLTQHNSDNRIRHGVAIWLAAPCLLGLADYVICRSDNFLGADQCSANFSEFYYIGIFFVMGFFWASLPHIAFFGSDKFDMGYWIECFALDTLAACGCLYYALKGYKYSETLQFLFLTIASIANMCALLHFVSAIIHQRGVFTPEIKWGPLSFMKLTHEAFRGNLATLRHSINTLDLDDESDESIDNLGLFAAHFNRFTILHSEHSKHEDQVIFKTFNDYFSDHAKKYNADHAEDHVKLEAWRILANQLLDKEKPKEERKDALNKLRKELPPFFDHFLEHLKGEEDNLNPIGKKYLPLEVMKQISRDVWHITPAEKWEMILPFIIRNLPRHMQRVRYLKVLCWSMPERAQQFGAIIYRNVDAVMWERLRTELPEIIPRGAQNYRRYY